MKNTLLALAVCSLVAACGGEADSGGEAAPQTPSVTILEPAGGAELSGSTVTVRLAVTGMPIVPAGDMTPGTGHHHLYLDAELAPATAPVPAVPGSIVHMGDASSTYTFEGVAPGEHRIIAVVADGAHVPVQPAVQDTVVFTVR